MFEYEIQQSRHAELIAQADLARLARQARAARKAARSAEDRRGGTDQQTGAGRTLRGHFTRAA